MKHASSTRKQRLPRIAISAFAVMLLAGGGTSIASAIASPSGSGRSHKSESRSSTKGTWAQGGVGASGEKPGNPAKITLKMTPALCGKKPMILGYNDGLGNNGFRRVAKYYVGKWAAECPNIKKVLYTDALGSSQKQISDFQGLVAQGANAIVTIDDAGPALLPAIKVAGSQGVAVSALSVSPGGTPGKDYAAFVHVHDQAWGSEWAKWMCTALPHGGNVVFFGGVPGNTQSIEEAQGIKSVFKGCKGIKLLSPAPINTGWTVAGEQTAASAILAKYPKIDGVISDFAAGSEGALAAFQAANRKVPPWAVDDDSESFTCKMLKLHVPIMGTSAEVQQETLVAVSKAITKYEGVADPLPATLDAEVAFNSKGSDKPSCNSAYPPGTVPSWGLTPSQIKGLGG
jgi:ribose transport system substrate-binding protein